MVDGFLLMMYVFVWIGIASLVFIAIRSAVRLYNGWTFKEVIEDLYCALIGIEEL